jgi:hypothetical protein
VKQSLVRRGFRPASLLVLLLAPGLLQGCGMGSPGGRAAATGSTPTAGGPSSPVAARDSAADRFARALRREPDPDRQLPPAVLAGLRPGAEDWVLAWRVGLGVFRLEQLERDRELALPPDTMAVFDAGRADQELRLRHLYVPSPDASLLVDVRLDWTLEERDGLVHARRTGSGGVLLVRLRDHVQQRILQPGPGGRVDGAVWIDPGTVAILASEPRSGNHGAGGPVVHVVDLARGCETRFVGPTTDADTFAQVGRRLDDAFRHQSPDLVFD